MEVLHMNSLPTRHLHFPVLAGLAISLSAMAEDAAPQLSSEGLQLLEKDRSGEIYANPNVDWSVYTEIKLEEATVAFRRNWQRDQNRYDPFKVRADDMEKMKARLSELFGEVFTEELSKDNGYVMAPSSGVNVLTIQPAIVDLDINAPDTMNSAGRSKQFTESAGEMTLKLALYDSVTGELLASASDRRESPYRGYLQWTTSVSNQADARRMLQHWAKALRERLDRARSNPAPAPAAALAPEAQ
jgi:hypothetical protein